MNLSNIIALLGGVGMFLYGMKLLGVSLERFAGAHLEKTLERLTNNPVKSITYLNSCLALCIVPGCICRT